MMLCSPLVRLVEQHKGGMSSHRARGQDFKYWGMERGCLVVALRRAETYPTHRRMQKNIATSMRTQSWGYLGPETSSLGGVASHVPGAGAVASRVRASCTAWAMDEANIDVH
jgi:hypothetical protein